MRIISGSRRGHKLLEFKGRDVRPTTDRVRESIMNLIQTDIADARVLDMFAGSGALSFEALSRGAAHAWLIDSDRRSIELVKRNIAALRFENECSVIRGSCFACAPNVGEDFDIIFLDPPYNTGLAQKALELVACGGFLSEDGIVVLESDSTDFKGETEGLSIVKQRRYGRTYITVYAKRKSGEE